MSFLSILLKVNTAKEASGKSYPELLIILIAVPALVLCIMMTSIIYMLTTPLGQVFSFFSGESIPVPEAVKDFKGQEHFITYAFISGNWSTSPPTYNNKIIEDYKEPEYDDEGNLVDEGHQSVTFGGSTLFFKRYAYAVDKGIVKEVTDNSITIEHQWGECIETDEEGNIISRHLTYYDLTYTNVEYDKKYCDKIKVDDEVVPGQKLYKIKLYNNMDFSVVRVCHDNKPFDPKGFVPLDDVENAPVAEDDKPDTSDSEKE